VLHRVDDGLPADPKRRVFDTRAQTPALTRDDHGDLDSTARSPLAGAGLERGRQIIGANQLLSHVPNALASLFQRGTREKRCAREPLHGQ